MGGRRCLRGGQFKGWEGASLSVQLLRLCAARASGSTPGCGTKIPHAWERSQKVFKKGVGWGGGRPEHFLPDAPVSCLPPYTPPPQGL